MKTTKNLRIASGQPQDSRSPIPDFNSALPEYEVGVVTLRPRRLVMMVMKCRFHNSKECFPQLSKYELFGET